MSTAKVTHKFHKPVRHSPQRASAIVPIGFLVSVSKALPPTIQRIVQHLQPEKIILFGSYAYGKPTPDSDVDLLVIMQTTATRAERYLAVSSLLRPRPFPVDILVKTPAEIQEALVGHNFFIQEIMAKGKVLYERPS